MSFSSLSAGDNIPNEMNVVIEITPETGTVKYEVDKDTGLLCVDRFMTSTMVYPCAYGYVPQTLGEDGDPLDVLVMTPDAILPGTFLTARPIAVLDMVDEAGGDAKILAVPMAKGCPQLAHINTLADVPELLLEKISHFFAHYKDLEPNKWVKVGGWENEEVAFQIINDGVKRYEGELTSQAS